MIKLIAFDFDGVIINEFDKHYEFSTKKYPGQTREQFKDLFNGNIHEERKKLKHLDTGFDIKKTYSEYKETLIIDSIIKKTLINLSKNYSLGMITSAKEEGTNTCLNNSGLLDTFSFVYGFETHPSKVEKFNKILKTYNLKTNEIIFVTDTVGDILEARKVGVDSIGIPGYHERERLEKVNPIDIVSNFTEIEKTIKKIKKMNYFSESISNLNF